MKLTRMLLISTALMAPLASCGEPATRSGGTAAPVVLVPATGGGPGVGNDVMDLLAEVTGDGSVQVGDVPQADQVTPGADRTLELLGDGSADIGVVRSGQLVTAGAPSLLALQAPFIVTNNQQAAAIAADPIAEIAMADLPKIGLVGLALVPGGLRHPFAYGDAQLVSADDFSGATINTRPDDAGLTAIMGAFGASQDHTISSQRTTGAQNGDIQGIEVSLQQYAAVDLPATITTNVTLYSKFDVIVIRETVWKTLSDAQRTEMMTAAASVRVSAPAARGTEVDLFREWCRVPGAASARADDADLASLHDALDPIVTSLEADPVAKQIIDRMRALGAGVSDELADLTCESEQTGSAPTGSAWKSLAPSGDQSVLDGTWRFTPSEADLLAAGATPSDARNNAEVWEVTLENGTGTATVGAGGHTCTWTFTFAGDKVLFNLGTESACGGLTAGTYRLNDDVVTFTWTDADDPYLVKLFNGIFGEAVKVTG